jgi:hypothetical protein
MTEEDIQAFEAQVEAIKERARRLLEGVFTEVAQDAIIDERDNLICELTKEFRAKVCDALSQ